MKRVFKPLAVRVPASTRVFRRRSGRITKPELEAQERVLESIREALTHDFSKLTN